MLVDDDAMLVRALERALRLEGFVVATSSGAGDEVSTMLRTFRPHLALIDVRMPTISGPDLVSEARAKTDAEGLRTKFILYSGFEVREIALLAEQSGADGWLSKDSDTLALAEALRGYLDPELLAS